jgi:hypothetical protein
MMAAIFGSGSPDKTLKVLHLPRQIFYLVFYNTDSLCVNRVCCILDRGMLFIDLLSSY